MNKIQVCFSPLLYHSIHQKPNTIVVVIDVLRATTSICAVLYAGASAVIPISDLSIAKEYKLKGYQVAAERDGSKLPFADYGNSTFDYHPSLVTGQEVVFSTTNGVAALLLAKQADKVVCGSFANLYLLEQYLISQNQNVLFLCSGWRGNFCIEDTLLAGAVAEQLLKTPFFYSHDDATHTALNLWANASQNPLEYAQQCASHVHRLTLLNLTRDIPHAFVANTAPVIPILDPMSMKIVKL